MARGFIRGRGKGGVSGRVRPRSEYSQADGVTDTSGSSACTKIHKDGATHSPITPEYTAHHYHVRRAINAALNDAEFNKAKTVFFDPFIKGGLTITSTDIRADEVLGQLCSACDNVMFALPVSDPVNFEKLTSDVNKVMSDKFIEKVGECDVGEDAVKCLEDAVSKFTSLFVLRTRPVMDKKTPPKDLQTTLPNGENNAPRFKAKRLESVKNESVSKNNVSVAQPTSGGLLGSAPLLHPPNYPAAVYTTGEINGDGFHKLSPQLTAHQAFNFPNSTDWRSCPSQSQHQFPILPSYVDGGLMPTPVNQMSGDLIPSYTYDLDGSMPPSSAELRPIHIPMRNLFQSQSPQPQFFHPKQAHHIKPLHEQLPTPFFTSDPVAPDIETRYITISPIQPGINRETLKSNLTKVCNLTKATAPPGTIISSENPVYFLNYDVFSKAQLIDMEEQLKEVEGNEEYDSKASTELKQEEKKAAANMFFATVSFDSSASASEAHRRINSMTDATGEGVRSAPMELAELVLLWGDNRSKIEQFQVYFLEQLKQFDMRQPRSLFQQLDSANEEIEACNVATEKKESNESVLNAIKRKSKLLDIVEEIMTKLKAENIDPKTPVDQRALVIPEEKYSSCSQKRPNGNDVRVLFLTGIQERMPDKKVMFMLEELLKLQPTKIWRNGNDLQVELTCMAAVFKFLRTLDCMEFEFGGIRFSREMPSTNQITD